MLKTLITATLIAASASATLADGIQPVVSSQGPASLRGLGSTGLTQAQLVGLAALAGISVIALVALLDDDGTDGTSGTN